MAVKSAKDEKPSKKSKNEDVESNGTSEDNDSHFSPSEDDDYEGPYPEGDHTLLKHLSGKKFVTVSPFNGKMLVGIREYYEKDGKMLPGRKGISLTLDQWEKLASKARQITKCMRK